MSTCVTHFASLQSGAKVTCVQSLLELFNLVGGARFSVYPLSVETMHLDVVNQLLHHQGHRPLVVSQTRNLHSELSGGELWIKLFIDTNSADSHKHTDMLRMYANTQAHRKKKQQTAFCNTDESRCKN